MCAIRWNFLEGEDIVGGFDLSAEGTFFAKYRGPSGKSQMLGGGIIILGVIRRPFLVCGRGPSCQPLPRIVHFRWMSFIVHVDHAVPRAPGRWTTARPRKGTTRSRGRLGNGCPRGGEYEGLLVRLPSPENNRRCG